MPPLVARVAYATSQFGKETIGSRAIKKESIGPGKLTKAAKAALVGPAGPRGATGAPGSPGVPGTPGSALAYARVDANGTLDVAHSKNITSVSHPAVNGLYCITPSVPVSNVVVSTPHVGPEPGMFAQADIVANGDTPNGVCGTPVYVTISNTAGTAENHPFYVVFN
jgi:hypothetical protein